MGETGHTQSAPPLCLIQQNALINANIRFGGVELVLRVHSLKFFGRPPDRLRDRPVCRRRAGFADNFFSKRALGRSCEYLSARRNKRRYRPRSLTTP